MSKMITLFFAAIIILIVSAGNICARKNPASKEHFLTGQFAVNFPVGEWSANDWKTGFGANGSFTYMPLQHIGVHFITGYNHWSYSKERSDAQMTITHNMGFTAVPLQVGASYFLANMNNFNPYAGLELVLYYTRNTWDADVDTDIPIIDLSQYTDGSQSDINPGFAVYAGFQYPLNYKLNLNVNLKFAWIYDKSECREDYGDWNSISYLGINAGVSYFL